ncbi:MAG: methylenetetrahydrofolate reductase C-terminal domain-containing protein [bacterium]
MIIAKKKPIEDIIKSLEGETNVFIVGCGECATVTQTGGEQEVAEMKAQLEEAGKKVLAVDVVAANCQELDLKRILRKHKEAAEEAEAFLVLSCGAGTQSVRAATDKHVLPGNDSLFLGNVQRSMDFVEKCSLCGDCILDDYGAICPVTRCAKGLLNGPCGGTSHGKCEVDPEMDCAWVLIHEQLKKEGREDKRTRTHSPKDWNVIAHPGKLAERKEKPGDK